jgi:hypothetical protein
MLDVLGPAEVFGDANRLRGDRPFYDIEVISASDAARGDEPHWHIIRR